MYAMAVDIMGGDNGSQPLVDAIIKFLKKHDDVHIIAVGQKEQLERLKGICETIEAKDVVPMTAGALDVLRMKESSMMKAITLVKEGKANGVVSCGSTGGFLASSTISLKMIKGVKRAALVTAMPLQEKGKYVTLLDCGANIENSSYPLAMCAERNAIFNAYSNGVKKDDIIALCIVADCKRPVSPCGACRQVISELCNKNTKKGY